MTKMKILISEDDSVSRLLLSATLKKLGHDVIETKDGKEAWEAFQKEYFQVLISDWMMPEMDGLELLQMIRAEKREKYTYILLLTVLEGKESYLEGMKAGTDDFITKPFDEEQLAARLSVAERILSLQTEVKQLQRLLPICSYCKKIRDDRNYWEQVEEYIGQRTGTVFSHGVCPDCYKKFIKPQLNQLAPKK
jgi:sigma-B regulation protein RsbU (phosphoserine phosphatase)